MSIRAAMRFVIAAIYAAAGAAHILATDVLLQITPGWVPYPRQMILATGFLELAAAAALFTERFRKPAAIAMAIYAICVWPANFKHAIDGIEIAHIPSSWWYHAPRLALQPVIAWWALYAASVIDWPFVTSRPKTQTNRTSIPPDLSSRSSGLHRANAEPGSSGGLAQPPHKPARTVEIENDAERGRSPTQN